MKQHSYKVRFSTAHYTVFNQTIEVSATDPEEAEEKAYELLLKERNSSEFWKQVNNGEEDSFIQHEETL